ncbi:MAG: nitroreductase family protein [Planctomycetota bacterium]|jgi:SagB-type dehydrogenase family enzyme
MKRLVKITIPFVIILAGLSIVSLAQNNQRSAARQARSRRNRSEMVSSMRTIQLSEPNLTGSLSLEKVLSKRRSVRQFSPKELTFSQIGQLVWAGQGITDSAGGLRTVPSSGAMYPLTLYIAINDGLFVYNPQNHSLEQILNRDIRNNLAEAALNQRVIADAACDIVIAGSARELMSRFQNESRKYMILEAGHAAQNILLQAVGLKLGSVPIGGFDVNRVRNLCQMGRDMEPLYIISVGHPQTQRQTSDRRQPSERVQRRMEINDATTLRVAILVVPSMNFNETELRETQQALTDAGIMSSIASTRRGNITGVSGGRARSEMLITQINPNQYGDGIIFIGGPGINEYITNPFIGQLVNNTLNQGKVVGAISNAPNILANAGVLNGYRVTALPTEQNFLERSGAKYTGAFVEKDGQIITAINPQAARQFGNAFAESLNQSFGLGERRIRSKPGMNYTR